MTALRQRILRALDGRTDPVSTAEIARWFGVSKLSATQACRALGREGLVRVTTEGHRLFVVRA